MYTIVQLIRVSSTREGNAVVITDFKINIKQQKVYDVVGTYYDIPQDLKTDRSFERIYERAKSIINPKGIYLRRDKQGLYDLETIDGCSHVYYCMVTLGQTVTDEVDWLFAQDRFPEALIIDEISNEILFDMSSQLYDTIRSSAVKDGLGLTCRLSPGDGELPITFQKDIFEGFDKEQVNGMYIFQGCMIYPVKSMAYIYGADSSIVSSEGEHMCSQCANLYCKRRKQS